MIDLTEILEQVAGDWFDKTSAWAWGDLAPNQKAAVKQTLLDGVVGKTAALVEAAVREEIAAKISMCDDPGMLGLVYVTEALAIARGEA